MKALSTAMKAQILSSLGKVSPETFVGYSIRHFVKTAHLKTDSQVISMIEGLQDQNWDNAKVMKSCLGSEYEFLMNINFHSSTTTEQVG